MSEITCVNCGTPNKPGLRYCTNCGFQLPAWVEPLKEEPAEQPKPQSKSNNKVIIGVIAGVALIGLIFYGVSTVLSKHKGAFYDGVLTGMADNINKTCPQMIDETTRMDSVVARKGKILLYSYTLVNLEEPLVDTPLVQANAEPLMVNMIKTDASLKLFTDRDVTFKYVYYTNRGDYFLTVAVTPEKYKQPQQPVPAGN